MAASREEVFERVKEVLAEQVGVDEGEISGDASFTEDLDLAVARNPYERHPDFSEGRMTKILAHVRSRTSCAAVALELGLDQRLLERGLQAGVADAEKLARNRNVLAAVVEAALAALYL